MYFSTSLILDSIDKLSSINPFFGITYLVCKKAQLPIGSKIKFPMDQKTKEFLEEFHRLHPTSQWFFQPYKTNNRSKQWVRPNYASTGLQSINTRTFGNAFIHESKTNLWGWQTNYLQILKNKLFNKKIPSFYLAVWLFRQKKWTADTKITDICELLFNNYHISEAEKDHLFDKETPSLRNIPLFQDHPVDWADLSLHITKPPDVGPDQGGTLSYLRLENIGPVKDMFFSPARRLNIITGDNGLGKSFLLESSWWALTGTWPEIPAYPKMNIKDESRITFELAGKTAHPERKQYIFDKKSRSWPNPNKRPTIPGLIVYARVDGSFAVWDPARFIPSNEDSIRKASLVFSRSEVWDGLPGNIEGLIRDWIKWQSVPAKYPFEIFSKVLAKLSPPDLGELRPGDPVRIPSDPRDIPTIVHSYGTTPILFSSAGVKRIITLAYLIVWAWNEHKINSDIYGSPPEARMVVMIDEIEAHLHPKWQRVILPAILDVQNALSKDLEIQFFVTTHSPLVMVSVEPIFSESIDQLFHLELSKDNYIRLEELNFTRLGQVNSWLTSPVFEMRHARSKEAEEAIEEAKNLQKRAEVTPEQVRAVNDKLVRYLAADDQFWPRWIYYAELHGVKT